VLVNAGCNKQAFSPKSYKEIARIRLVVFEKNAKNEFRKMTSPEPKARLF